MKANQRCGDLEERRTGYSPAASAVQSLMPCPSSPVAASCKGDSDNKHMEQGLLPEDSKNAARDISPGNMGLEMLTDSLQMSGVKIFRKQHEEPDHTHAALQININDKGDGNGTTNRMLPNIEEGAVSPTLMIADDDLRIILAGFDRRARPSDRKSVEDYYDYLKTLHIQLNKVLSLCESCYEACQDSNIPNAIEPGRSSESEGHKMDAVMLENTGIQKATAPQPETVEHNCDNIHAWTIYSFGPGLGGDDARRHEIPMVKRIEKKWVSIRRNALLRVLEHQMKKEQRNRHRCLIMSNIAAGADENDVMDLFSRFDLRVRKITIVERDPRKGTQTAYIDMADRPTAAVAFRCISLVGAIFGLQVKVTPVVLDVDQAGNSFVQGT